MHACMHTYIHACINRYTYIPDSLHFLRVCLVFDIFEQHPPISRALFLFDTGHALCSKIGYTFSVIIFTTEYSSIARKNLS
jgi:hypothetical protein